MKNKNKSTVSFKVLDEDRKEVIKTVRELLTQKGYTLYEKQEKRKSRKRG